MPSQRATTVATYCILAFAGVGSFTLPDSLPTTGAVPVPSPPTIHVTAVVRDFVRAHPDFDAAPSAGYGHYAGNVARHLGVEGVPVFTGVSLTDGPVTDFTLDGQDLSAPSDVAMMVTVIGAAITSGGVDQPVTCKVNVGDDVLEPFGPYSLALSGNVNDDANPRRFIFGDLVDAGAIVGIGGRSWNVVDTDVNADLDAGWAPHLSASSLTGSPYVKVLRDGDAVPDIAGFDDQTSVAGFLHEFIDPNGGTIVLNDNQVIYLFELGTTSLASAAADFQDLVVLVTLGTSPSYLAALDAFGNALPDAVVTPMGRRVDEPWTDASGRPIAPHLFRSGAVPSATVATPVTIPAGATLDAWDSALGPYDGDGAPATIETATPPAAVAPPAGTSVGEVVHAVDATIVGDVACSSFRVEPNVTLSIAGPVSIVSTGAVELGAGARVELLQSGALDVWAGEILLGDGARLNMNTWTPGRARLHGVGDALVELAPGAAACARIAAPDGLLRIREGADLHGGYAGEALDLASTAGLHLDGPQPIVACGTLVVDDPGVAGPASTGGITSAATFAQWFDDYLGTNLSTSHVLQLVHVGDGVYEFHSEAFYPIDDALLGNEGEAHNSFFTGVLATEFTYAACDGQFFEFEGSDDGWLFVNGELVMDVGGVLTGTSQHVAIDRLGLVDGETYDLVLFFANRQSLESRLHLRTNILQPSAVLPMVTSSFD